VFSAVALFLVSTSPLALQKGSCFVWEGARYRKMNGSSRGQENRFWDEEAAEIASTEAVDSGAFQSLLKSQAAGVHQTSARNSLVTTTSSGVPPVINEEAPLLDEPLLSSSHTEDPQWNHRTPSFHEGTFQQQNSVHNDNDDDQNPTLEPIRRMEYDSDSHLAVLFQMYGSVWPYVFPYCVFTVLLTVAVFLLQRQGFNNISFPTTNGHTFLSILVSFLVVTRANITYQRFMEAREYLNTCYRSCRELMHYTCVLTQQDTSEGAQEWRRQVAYKTILLLRVTMAAIDVSRVVFGHQSSAVCTTPLLQESLLTYYCLFLSLVILL
jgi:hypothetical protein